LLGLLYEPEDGGSTFFRNVVKFYKIAWGRILDFKALSNILYIGKSYPLRRHARVRKTKKGTDAFIFPRMDTYWKIKQTGGIFAYESNRVSGGGNP
jgi:hypothetical protein